MLHALGSDLLLGYCGNVHPASGYAQVLENLQRYALAAKAVVCPGEAMGVGLWLPADTAREIVGQGQVAHMREWLGERGLCVFTINGFPQADFHGAVVKHRVYEPGWADARRMQYTLDLVEILSGLLGAGAEGEREGSISTVPIGWGRDDRVLAGACSRLVSVVERLEQLEKDTGRLIHLDLEPEPGCRLATSADVVELFTQHLDPLGNAERTRRYLRVCHDVCHAAVMFEEQADALRAYESAGIAVGKVQLSSALDVRFDRMGAGERAEALAQLGRFAEDRYLHQTVVQLCDGATRFYEDLPQALAERGRDQSPVGHWRVHFHVPLFLDRIGALGTTQDSVGEFIGLLTHGDSGARRTRHYEIETYAWSVLPGGVVEGGIAQGMAREVEWVGAIAQGAAGSGG